MDGAVKMPGAQMKMNTASRVQTAQSSDSGIEFIRLMQAKNSQTKASVQEKAPQKAENKTQKPSKDVREKPDKVSDEKLDVSSENPKTEESSDTDEMAQQAAMQQAAAQLAGMLDPSLEVSADETALPEEGIFAAGDLLAEETPADAAVMEMPEISEPDTAESILPELAEAKAESFAQAVTPEDSANTQAAQAEAAQPKPVSETAEKEVKPAEAKTEKAKAPDKADEPIQDVPGSQKAEEKAETGKQPGQEEFSGAENRKAEENTNGISQSENGQAQAAAGAESFKVFGQQGQQSFFGQRTEAATMKTSPETIPQDLGKILGAKMAEGARTLTLELEPANLGKLTIHLSYEGDRAAVSIMATNPKTLEILNQKASELAAILEEKTGQETLILTQKPETNQENYDRNPDGKREREEQEEKHHHQQKEEHQNFDSFAQQLRLGLV